MTPITLTIHVSKNEIYPKRIYAGTRGSFGLTKLNFELSPEWDGAACTVVFHPKRGKPISVAWAGIPIDVPYEIMQYSGISSFVFSGTVYTDGKAEGKRISLPGEVEVLYTLEDEGINTKGFTPELYLQILALIGNLGDLTTEAKENLVSAINEAAQSGGEVIDEKAVIEIIKKYIDEKVTPADIGAASVEDLNEKLTGSIEEDGEPVMLVTEDDLNNAVAKLEEKMTAITDEGGYFASENIEGALQEIGAELSGINTLLGTGVLE